VRPHHWDHVQDHGQQILSLVRVARWRTDSGGLLAAPRPGSKSQRRPESALHKSDSRTNTRTKPLLQCCFSFGDRSRAYPAIRLRIRGPCPFLNQVYMTISPPNLEPESRFYQRFHSRSRPNLPGADSGPDFDGGKRKFWSVRQISCSA
jgi:hypothetical protein